MQMSQHAKATSPAVKALCGLLALAVAMGIGRFAFTPVLPMMLQDASLSITNGGMLASANYLGYLIGALSAMVIRIRPQTAIRWGLLAIGVLTLAMGIHAPFIVWALLRALAGISSAWVLISVSAWCLETLAGYQRPSLNSIVFAGVGTGIAAAGLLCIVMIQLAAHSSQAWFALGIVSLIVVAMLWRFFQTPDEQTAGKHPRAHATYRWNGESIRLVFCYGAFGFGYIIPATFLPVMAKAALHGSGAFAWSWPIFGLAAGVSTLAVTPLSQRVSNRHIWIVSHLIMAIGIALPVWSPQLLSIFAAALCVGGTFMVITLVAMQEAKRVAGRDATVLIAAMTSAFAAGQIAGPMAVALGVGGSHSFSVALLSAAFLLVLSAGALSMKNTVSQTQQS